MIWFAARFPEITVSIKDGYWIYTSNHKEYKIDRISRRFLAVIKALQKNCVDCKIWLDPEPFENPFIKRHIENVQKWGLTPIYEDVDKMLHFPEKKECNLCGADAWFCANVNMYQCWNCKACESMLDKGRFFRLSKHTKK